MKINAEIYKKLFPLKFHQAFFERGIRSDSRKLDQIRNVHISKGILSNIDSLGSSMIRLGDTIICCNVDYELLCAETLFRDVEANIWENDDCRSLVMDRLIDIKLTSSQNSICPEDLASESKNFSINAYAQKIKDLVINSEIFDQKSFILKFCGKTLCDKDNDSIMSVALNEVKQNSENIDEVFCWVLKIDILILNNDGNIFDSCLMALSAALMNSTINYNANKTNQIFDSRKLTNNSLSSKLSSLFEKYFENFFKKFMTETDSINQAKNERDELLKKFLSSLEIPKPMHCLLSVSWILIDDKYLMCDPTLDEENFSDNTHYNYIFSVPYNLISSTDFSLKCCGFNYQTSSISNGGNTIQNRSSSMGMSENNFRFEQSEKMIFDLFEKLKN